MLLPLIVLTSFEGWCEAVLSAHCTCYSSPNGRALIVFFVVESDIAGGIVSERPWLFELSTCHYVCLVS